MIVFLNGSFGIGKTSVARQLRRQIPGSAIFDPELVGLALRRLPRFVPLEGRGTDDFQDLALWRRASVLGIRGLRAVRATIIVPMAFTNLSYLGELVDGVKRFEPAVRHFCLIAPLPVVLERLARRGAVATDPSSAWQIRRAGECCAAHEAAQFAEHVSAEHATPAQIATEIVSRLLERSGR